MGTGLTPLGPGGPGATPAAAADVTAAQPTPARDWAADQRPLPLRQLEYARQQLAAKKWSQADADEYARTYGNAESLADLAHKTSLGSLGNWFRTLPFAPQLQGAFQHITQGQPYAKARDAAYRAAQLFRTAHPAAAVAGPMAAALPTLAVGPEGEMGAVGTAATMGAGGAAGAGLTALGLTDPSKPWSERAAESAPATAAGAVTGVGSALLGRGATALLKGRGTPGRTLAQAIEESTPDIKLAPSGAQGAAGLREAASTMEGARPGQWVPADLSPQLREEADFSLRNNALAKAKYQPDLRARAYGAPARVASDLQNAMDAIPQDFNARYRALETGEPILKGNDLVEGAVQNALPHLQGATKQLAQQALAKGDFASYNNLRMVLRDEGRRMMLATNVAPRQLAGGLVTTAKQSGSEMVKAAQSLRNEMGRAVPGFEAVQSDFEKYATAKNFLGRIQKMKGTQDPAKQFVAPSIQDAKAIHTVFQSPDEFAKWMQRAHAEEAMEETGRVGGGSPTHGAAARAESEPREGLRESVNPFKPESWWTRFYMSMPGFGKARANQATAARMAPLLLNRNQSIDSFLRAVEGMNRTRGALAPLGTSAVGGAGLGGLMNEPQSEPEPESKPEPTRSATPRPKKRAPSPKGTSTFDPGDITRTEYETHESEATQNQ